MQIIGGNRNRQEAILEANPALVGDSLSIALSQLGTSTAVWTLDVDVQTKQGRIRLGSLVTTAPSAGDPPARIVGFASCPGATGWMVSARSTTVGDIAELNIASSKCCASELGITPNSGSTVIVDADVNVKAWGGALVAAAQALADTMTNAILVPIFGARLEGYNATDGWNRLRVGLAAVGLFDLKVGGAETARSVHLAAGALPAAGAFTAQAAYAIPSGLGEITAWVTYTRGAAGGFPIFHVMWGNGTETGQDVNIDSAVTVTQPQGRQNVYEQELAGPQPSGAGAITYAVAIRVPRGATAFQMLAAEAGVTGTPGTIAIAIAGGTLR